MHLILIGMPKVGKTTYGKMLAKKRGYAFIDTDHLIEKAYQQDSDIVLSCSEIYRSHGKDYFRSLEKEAVLSINPSTQTVIATGGGTLTTCACRDHLRNLGKFIYLRASYEYLRKKILSSKKFPAYLPEKCPEEALRQLYQTRTEIFEKEAYTIYDIEQIIPSNRTI